MKNGFELIRQTNPLDSQSINLSPSILNKNYHYFNLVFNHKNDKNINPATITHNIKIKNYSSPKYKNKKNNLKHYNITINAPSINKKLLSKTISKKPIITEPQCGLEKFLPPKNTNKHKTLVIDLDETLIHSYFDMVPPRKSEISFEIFLDNKNVQVYTLIRPGAVEFLEKMSEIFEIVIFTASLSMYALPIINYIDKGKKCEFKLFREHCSIFNNGFIKDLKRLSRDLNNLILLDNNPNSYFLNKENGFPIKTWIDDLSDNELFKIIPYLEFLGEEYVKDVRTILTKIKIGNEVNYPKFNKIIENFQKTKNCENDNKTVTVDGEKTEEIKKDNNKENQLNNSNEKNIENNNNFEYEKNSKKIENKLNKITTKYANIMNNEPKNKRNRIDNFFKIIKDEKVKNKEENKNNIKNNNKEGKALKENNKIIDNEKNNSKNILKNKIKNKYFISKPKYNKEDFSENLNINDNNLFNRKKEPNIIDYQLNDRIKTSIKQSHLGVFINSNPLNKNNISLIDKNKEKDSSILQTELISQISSKHNIKPIIRPINLSSKFVAAPNNNEEKSKKNVIYDNNQLTERNKSINIVNNLGNIKLYLPSENEYVNSPSNLNYLNNIYLDYHKTKIKNNSKYNNYNFIRNNKIPHNKNSIKINAAAQNNINNTKSNDLSFSGVNIIRSKSENNRLFYNLKSLDDAEKSKNKNYYKEIEKKYKEKYSDKNDNKMYRSLSTSKKVSNNIKTNHVKLNINNINSNKKDTNYRCLSSHQNIFNNFKYNNYNYVPNYFNYKKNNECQDQSLNQNKSFSRKIKNILYTNKSNFINKRDFSPFINNDSKLNGSNYEIKVNYSKNSKINWKKSNLFI